MLRVISKSIDTCSHRKGVSTRIYLCLNSRPGEALLCEDRLCCYPTRARHIGDGDLPPKQPTGEDDAP